MYADTISDSMKSAIKETNRRRKIQEQYNIDNNITPTTILKEIRDNISNIVEVVEDKTTQKMTRADKEKMKAKLEMEMKNAAKELDFERAMELRDILFEMQE